MTMWHKTCGEDWRDFWKRFEDIPPYDDYDDDINTFLGEPFDDWEGSYENGRRA